jgi:GAF domain-containing protein
MTDEDGGRTRLARASETCVQMIDTLVEDFDVIDVLTVLATQSVELVGAAEAGILLADDAGTLRVVAASSEQIVLLELFQIQNEQGPCMDAYRTGQLVVDADLRVSMQWPKFAAESTRAGFPSVCAIPLRLRTVTLGCLNLFMCDPLPLPDSDIALAQALADVASIAIVQDHVARDAAIRLGRLEHALTSRILIEQAKGILAQHRSIDMDQAFNRLRQFARNNNRGLTDVAAALVAGDLRPTDFSGPPKRPPPGIAAAR